MATIKIKRGLHVNLPLEAADGELLFTTDRQELWIGKGAGQAIKKLTISVDDLQNLINGKASSVHTHAISDVTGLQTALDNKTSSGHSHTIADVSGLQTSLDGKANNTHNHSISDITNLQTQLDSKANSSSLGTAATKDVGTSSGQVPILNTNGKLDDSVIPNIAVTDTFVVNSQADMLALSSAGSGDIAIRTDLSKCFILSQTPASTLSNWKELLTPVDNVLSVNNKTGSVVLNAADVGAATAVHTHTISDVTNLQTTLNDKVNTSDFATIQNNVNTLNSQLTTFFSTFNDSFADSTYIDNTVGTGSTNLVRVTSGSETYIRANRQYNVEVNTNLQIDADTVNTNNISYSSGALQLTSGQTDGTFTSKFYNVNATTQAIVGADFTQVSADTFGNEQAITPPSGTLQTDMINFTTVTDSTGIRWYFYQTLAGWGRIYGWAVNTDGTSFMSHREISSGLTTSSLPSAPAYKTLSVKVDKNDNVWIAVFRVLSAGSYTNSRMSTIKISKATPTTQTVVEDFVIANAVSSVDTFYDFTNDRFHWVASIANTTFGVSLRVFQCNTNSLVSGASRVIYAAASAFNVKLAYNANTQEVVVFIALSSLSNGLRCARYSVNTGTYGNQTQAPVTINSSSSSVFDAFYHATHGYVVVNIRNGGTVLELAKLSTSFTGTSDYLVQSFNTLTGGIVVPPSDSSAFADSTHIHMVYGDSNTTNKSLYYTKIRMSDGSITEANNSVFNRVITVTNYLNDSYPVLERYNNTTTLYFVQEGNTGAINPERIVFGNNSSKIKVEAQSINDNWVTVYDNFVSPTVDQRGSLLTLSSSSKTQIRIRVTLQSPNASTMTPTLNAYQAYIPDNSLGQTIATFISKSTFNDRTISKVKLTTDQNPKSGTIQWYMSNDGGLTWSPQITLGSEYSFASVGGDLKVKAVLTIPSGSINVDSPRIDSYTLVTSNSVVQSDIVPIQINLARTNFRFAALQNATRYSMKNMVVDTFTDSTGINVSSSSNYTFDNTNKLVRATNTATQCIVTVPTESLTVAPVSIFISSDVTAGTGSVTFEASRDGGTTWKAVTNEVVTNLNDITSGTQLVVRAKINGNATLNAWAYSWS